MISSEKINIHKLVALPTMAASLVFAIIFYLVLVLHFYQRERISENGIRETVQSQLPFLLQEIYLGQTSAYETRLENIREMARKNGFSSDLCLDLSLVGQKSVIESRCDSRNSYKQSFPLLIGLQHIGDVSFSYRRKELNSIGLYALIVPAVSALLIGLITQFFLVVRIFSRVVEPFLERIAEQEQNAAIISTTQCLAHDVRKPFSLMRLGLSRAIELSVDEAQRISLRKLLSSVSESSLYIEGLLSDLMDIGLHRLRNEETIDLAKLIYKCTEFIGESYPEVYKQLVIDISASLSISGEEFRLRRALINVVDNAFQAADVKGGKVKVSLSTFSRGGSLNARISVENTESYIPSHLMEQIFSPYFSHGKKNGTGLGLFIAKKSIEIHRGTIVCESDEGKRLTKFIIELPDCSEINFPEQVAFKSTSGKSPDNFLLLVNDMPPGPIVVVDDDPFILDTWQNKASAEFDVRTYLSPSDFWKSYEKDSFIPKLVLTDYFFDSEDSVNGVSFALELKSRIGSPIVLCSDAKVSKDENSIFTATFTKEESLSVLDSVLNESDAWLLQSSNKHHEAAELY